MGIGNSAFEILLKTSQFQGKEFLFLSVIDTNVKAIRFYEKLGFSFHSKTRLYLPYFREELKGMHRMVKALD